MNQIQHIAYLLLALALVAAAAAAPATPIPLSSEIAIVLGGASDAEGAEEFSSDTFNTPVSLFGEANVANASSSASVETSTLLVEASAIEGGEADAFGELTGRLGAVASAERLFLFEVVFEYFTLPGAGVADVTTDLLINVSVGGQSVVDEVLAFTSDDAFVSFGRFFTVDAGETAFVELGLGTAVRGLGTVDEVGVLAIIDVEATEVSEPATSVLFAAALGGIVGARRRRRATA